MIAVSIGGGSWMGEDVPAQPIVGPAIFMIMAVAVIRKRMDDMELW